MAIPKYDELMTPTIQALKQLGGRANIKEIHEKVATIIGLSKDDIKENHDGNRTKLSYLLAWSRTHLKKFGLIKNTAKGIWELTSDGKKIDKIDKNNLKQFINISNINWSEEDSNRENETIELESNEEDEDEDNDAEDIISPFDPKDIQIIVEPKTIDHLVTRLRYDEIDMNTEFQRKGNLWSPGVQSRLIESILLRLPLPAFYFDATDDNKWLVVDGLQRLWTIKNFVNNTEKENEENPLELTGLEILTDYSDKGITFDKLNRTMQRRILETPITTYLIQPGTPKDVKYNVFRRINTGGLGLNSMEIRNALNQGKPSNFLKELSEDNDIRSLLRIQDNRMDDRELLLRAYAFINTDYTQYKKPLSTFLDRAMEGLMQKTSNELDTLAQGIFDSIFLQMELFGKHIFSRSILGGPARVKLNSALFEVWVSAIYKLNNQQRDSLLKNKKSLIDDYKLLLKDESFIRSIASSTSARGAVKIRFEKVIQLINKFI